MAGVVAAEVAVVAATAGVKATVSLVKTGASVLVKIGSFTYEHWDDVIFIWKLVWKQISLSLEDIVVAFNTGHAIVLSTISNFFLESLISGSRTFPMSKIDVAAIFAPSTKDEIQHKLDNLLARENAGWAVPELREMNTWDLGEIAKLFVIQIRYYHNFLIEKGKMLRETSAKIRQLLTNDMVFYGYFARTLATLRFTTTLLYHFYVDWFHGNSEVDVNLRSVELRRRQENAHRLSHSEGGGGHVPIEKVGMRLRDTVNRAQLQAQMEAFLVELQAPNTLKGGIAENRVQFLSVLRSEASSAGTLQYHVLFAQYVHYLNMHATLYVLGESVSFSESSSPLPSQRLVRADYLAMEAAFSRASVYADMNSPLVKAFAFMEAALAEDISYLLRRTGLAGPVDKTAATEDRRRYPANRNASQMLGALTVDWVRGLWDPIRAALTLYAQFATTAVLIKALQAFADVQLGAAAVRTVGRGTRNTVYSDFSIIREHKLWRKSTELVNKIAISELLRSTTLCLLGPMLYAAQGAHRSAVLGKPVLVVELVVTLLYQLYLTPVLQRDFPDVRVDVRTATHAVDATIPLGEAMNDLFVGLEAWRERRRTTSSSSSSHSRPLLSHILQLREAYPKAIRARVRELTELFSDEPVGEEGEAVAPPDIANNGYIRLWRLGALLLQYVFEMPAGGQFLSRMLLSYLDILVNVFSLERENYQFVNEKGRAGAIERRMADIRQQIVVARDELNAVEAEAEGAEAEGAEEAVARVERKTAKLQRLEARAKRKEDILASRLKYPVLRDTGLYIPGPRAKTRSGLRVQRAVESIGEQFEFAENALIGALRVDENYRVAVLAIDDTEKQLVRYDRAFGQLLAQPHYGGGGGDGGGVICTARAQEVAPRNELERALQVWLDLLNHEIREELGDLLHGPLYGAEMLRAEVIGLLNEIDSRVSVYKAMVRGGILLSV